MESRRFDGVELLRKLRDKEINLDTKIRSISACGNEYNITINAGANKFIFDDGRKVSTGYLSNSDNKFEIIEEEKKIPEKIKSNGKEFYCDNIDSWIDKEKTSAYCEYLMNKYNDLIDYLKSKGDE